MNQLDSILHFDIDDFELVTNLGLFIYSFVTLIIEKNIEVEGILFKISK